jgi:hypothetical protein
MGEQKVNGTIFDEKFGCGSVKEVSIVYENEGNLPDEYPRLV